MATKRTMRDLLVEEMRDIYDGEKQITKALPKMARAAQDQRLREAFEMHLEQTQGQIERLNQAFEKLNERARAKHCHAIEGLVEEAKDIMDADLSPELRDAALIAAAQKVEHYEIASYGTVHAYAQAIGETDVADLLEQTLREEKETDQKLNQLAVGEINKKAMNAA